MYELPPTAEVKEAKKQPGRYHLMDKDFLALVARKLERGEVFFLKRDDLRYNHYPGKFQHAQSA